MMFNEQHQQGNIRSGQVVNISGIQLAELLDNIVGYSLVNEYNNLSIASLKVRSGG